MGLQNPQNERVRAVRYLGPYPRFIDARGRYIEIGEVGLVRVEALSAFGENIEPAEWTGDAGDLEVEAWPKPKQQRKASTSRKPKAKKRTAKRGK